jgi:transcriptional regulator with PAS, ATPase and Fis domain
MERVKLVANSDLPVLILGETGTGKELIARAIHKNSNRSKGPIIRVNCGAIPPELIDSQLLGTKKVHLQVQSKSMLAGLKEQMEGHCFLMR